MTLEEYKNTFDGRPSVIKFGAEWCNPCKVMEKTLANIEPKYPNVNFVHVDVEESPELCQEFQITNIPVLYFISPDGEHYVRKNGILTEKAIADEIENIIK